MTPTLRGRWQTRILLLCTVGVFVTFFFAPFLGTFAWINLFLVLVLGLFWDVLYIQLQKRRWDHDWPPVYQLFEGIFEGVVIYLLVGYFFSWIHYGAVWWAVFLMTQGPLRIIFPRWRFRGGRWL